MRLIVLLFAGLIISGCKSQKSPMTEQEFAKIYLDSLIRKYPDVTFTLGSDLTITSKKGELDFRHYIDNAYIAYKAEPDSIKAVISRYLRSTTDLYAEKEKIKPENIVPVIKPIEYLDEINLLSAEGKAFPMVTEKYNETLIIAYAVDSKNSISYLTEDGLKTLALSKDSLKSIALRNLDKLLPDIQRQGDNGLYMITAGGDYEASLILLSSIWTKENFPVDGEFIVAIPNRDLLMVTGSNNKSGIDKIKGIAADSYKTGNYKVSEYLYKRKGDKFEKYN